jgi:DeoR family suf operon transcriptional repressor
MEKIKTTRERILHTLLSHPRSTIADLAAAAGINSISVRHHLNYLQANGLVSAAEERHGIGRPRLVYSLTEQGFERFPTSYLRLMNQLLAQLKLSIPEDQLDKIFSQIATTILEKYVNKLKSLSFEERINLIQEILTQEGFTIELERKENGIELHEITCPYYQIGQNHPEVCKLDQKLISGILSIPAEKIQCVLRGDAHCIYIIPIQPA